MNTIQNLFQQAQLAEAAYANFLNGTAGLVATPGELIAALQNTGNNLNFSAIQAAAFATRYQVISQQPNTANGFSATVFLDTTSGKYIFAARGTEPGLTKDRVTH